MNNGIFNIEPVLARTQILVHTRGGYDFAAVLQTHIP